MPPPTPTASQKAAKDWYLSPGGNIWAATGAEADFLKYVLGWSGPYTYADAQANAKTIPGPLKALNKDTTSALNNVKNSNPLQGVADIGDFFHRLSEPQTWVRVGEVALGGILLYVGLRALAQGSSAVGSQARSAATKPAKKVAKKAVSVAAPEVRLATRVAAKKVAPKTTARVSAHRANVAKYGQRKPYSPPPPKPPKQPTVRVSHIYHHKGPGKP